jgi:hypothetical protein
MKTNLKKVDDINLKATLENEENNLQNFSSNLYGIRKVLIEQFNRIEKDLQNKFKEAHTHFATKEELFSILSKINEFRKEIEHGINQIEEVHYEKIDDELLIPSVFIKNQKRRSRPFRL